MLRHSIIWTAVLAATAAASPVLLDPRTPPSSKSSSSCTLGDTSSTEAVKEILDSTGSNEWLDKKLETLHGEEDWVNRLWLDTFPNDGRSPLTGCGTVGSNCDPISNCSDYPSEQAYWTFTAVGSLHSKATAVHDKLLWKGWLGGLSIDQIGKDFSVPTPDLSWLKWIAVSFTMVTGVATAGSINAGTRGIMGIAAGAFTAAANGQASSSTIDTASVKVTLKNMVGSVGDYVSQILANATGNGDPDDLPNLNQNTMFTHATAQFYQDDSLLLDENKDHNSFLTAYDGFTENIEKKLVDVSMKNIYYTLLADKDISESSCKNTYGAYWLEGKPNKFRCFYLTSPTKTAGCTDNDPGTCQDDLWMMAGDNNHQMGRKVYDKLTETYKFDLEGYYKSLIDCHVNGNGEVDMTGFTKGIPRCFYNVFVREGIWHDNTSGWPILALWDLK